MRRSRLVGSSVAAVAVTAGLLAWAPWSSPPGEGGTGHEVAAAPAVASPTTVSPTTAGPSASAPAPPTTAPRPAVPADATWIATLHSALPYSETPGGPAVGTLPATDPFGAADVVAVLGTPGADGWSHVELPVRPDGSTGWIRTASTTLTWTTYKVSVSVAARTITVTDGAATVLQAPVAVGAASTPTPAGATYVWELVAPDDPHGAYGPYILGLGMFSNAISVFNGGDAQIGIHGNDDASSIGRPVSHGCVRLDNTLISRLASLLPLGTPVTIA